MKKVIDLNYNHQTQEISIQCHEKKMDVTAIQNTSVADWIQPVMKNGLRWCGLYEELKFFCQTENFDIVFHGSDSDFQMLQNVLKEKEIRVFKNYHKFDIFYNRNHLSALIISDGTDIDFPVFQEFPLETVLKEIPEKNWKGLFTELQEYVHNEPYQVTFIGTAKDVALINGVCPENVKLTCQEQTDLQNAVDSSISAENTEKIQEKIIVSEENQEELPMNMNLNSSQSVIMKHMHCPYCNGDEAVLISEVTGQRTAVQLPDYGMKYWLSVIFTCGIHMFVCGFPMLEKKRIYEHTTYGFCPHCGNSYNAGVSVSVSRAELQKTKVYLNKKNKKIMGVCSGVAEFTGLSVKLVRLVMVLYALTFFPVILYITAGLLMDENPETAGEFYGT